MKVFYKLIVLAVTVTVVYSCTFKMYSYKFNWFLRHSFINTVILRSKKTPVCYVEFVAVLDGSLELDVERPAGYDRADKDCTSIKGLERRYVTVSPILVDLNMIEKKNW